MSSEAMTQISDEEREQLNQTIEMFEVITQANPNDCQSLEVLKEAYWKLELQDKAVATTRKLADTYVNLGQYSSAVLEYEGILQRDPDSPEIVNVLAAVEAKLAENGGLDRAPKDDNGDGLGFALDFDLGAPDSEDANLITTADTHRSTDGENRRIDPAAAGDGNDSLAKFLIQHQIAPESVVKASLERVRQLNDSEENSVAASLIGEIVNSNVVELEEVLNGILDRTKFAYVPLEYYEIDRQIVKMLPESLTLERLIVPFDLMSRTVMIAMANPFDALGKESVQQLFDYNIQWHLASPKAIRRALGSVYKLEVG